MKKHILKSLILIIQFYNDISCIIRSHQVSSGIIQVTHLVAKHRPQEKELIARYQGDAHLAQGFQLDQLVDINLSVVFVDAC